MLEVLLICIAVCADAFAVSCAYGLKRIKIRPLSAALIGFIGAAFLGLSLAAAGAASRLFPSELCKTLSASLLILIAMKNLTDAQSSPQGDENEPPELSIKSSVILASALSADSLGVGLGAGVTMTSACKLYAVVLCLVLGILSVALGYFFGSVCAKGASRYRLALLSSAILFVTAVMKLV